MNTECLIKVSMLRFEGNIETPEHSKLSNEKLKVWHGRDVADRQVTFRKSSGIYPSVKQRFGLVRVADIETGRAR